VKFQIFSIGVTNDDGKTNKKYNPKNDLTFTEHIAIFMQI